MVRPSSRYHFGRVTFRIHFSLFPERVELVRRPIVIPGILYNAGADWVGMDIKYRLHFMVRIGKQCRVGDDPEQPFHIAL